MKIFSLRKRTRGCLLITDTLKRMLYKLDGWLITTGFPVTECIPIMLRMQQSLVNPHCWKQPSGSPSSTLISFFHPNLPLTISNYLYARVSVIVHLCLSH